MIGQTVSHYRILAELGGGGMGVVYEAEDLRLGRQVALKFLTAALESPQARERFRREARAASALNHPHICVVHDLGEHEGKPFIAMERMRGQTLKQLIAGRPLAAHRAMELASQVADALEAAHAAGILHRDLKPANVFVTEHGEAKLMDFGLAKTMGDAAVDTEAPTEERLTQSGVLPGTLAYMSPEQAQGEKLDGRSDLFSLGILMYEMATGRLPFDGRTAAEIYRRIVTGTPAAPTAFNPEIPSGLQAVIRKALEKERSVRYQHASEIRADLTRLIRDATPGAGAASWSGPSNRRSRRGLVVGAVAAALALALGVGWLARRGGGARTPSDVSPSPKRIAVLPFENLGAPEDGYFADGMTDEVRGKLTELSGLAVIARASSNDYKGSTKPQRRIAQELDVGYLLTATVRWQKSGPTARIRLTPELVDLAGGGAPSTRWQQVFEADLSDVFRVQGEIATRVAESLQVALSGTERDRLAGTPTTNLSAYDAYLKGSEIQKEGSSPAALRRAAAQYEQAVALDPGFAPAWARLSLVRSYVYRVGVPSQQEAEGARQAAQRALEVAPTRPEGYAALGYYYQQVVGDREKAAETYGRGLKVAPDDSTLLVAMARVERGRGRPEEAVAHLRRARELDPRSWDTERVLGETLSWLHRTGEARAVFDRGLALAPANLNLIHLKATTYLQDGDLAGARAVMAAAPKEVEPAALVAYFANYWDLDWVLDDAQRAVLLRLTPGAFGDNRAAWGIILAQAWARRGDAAKVREHAEEARKGFAAQLAEAPGNAQLRAFLGLSLAYLGRSEDAVREGEAAVALAPTSTYTGHLLLRIHILSGNPEKALDLLESLIDAQYLLTPGWLRIDPNFDTLRGNARFERLANRR